MEENYNVEYSKIASELDAKQTTRFYWILVAIATTGGFLFGLDTANIGSALLFIPYKLTVFELGYLVAGASLGAAVGALIAGPLTDRSGRKYMLIADAIIYGVGALLSAVAIDTLLLLIARTVIGIGVGADSAIATAYIVEMAPKDKRGKLAVMQQMMIVLGILAAFLIAVGIFAIKPVLSFEVTYGWRILLGVAVIPAILAAAFRTKIPESPRWLVLHGKFEKAQKSLKMMGITVSLNELMESGKKEKIEQKKLKQKKFWTPGVKYAFTLMALWMIFQQITGINIPLYYGPYIISRLHMFPTVVNPVTIAIYSILSAFAMAWVFIPSTYIMMVREDKTGRRKLGLIGYIGMAIGMFVTYILLIRHIDVGILFSLGFYLIMFSIGVGGAGWLLQGEMFPTEHRGMLAAGIAAVDWIANFVIIEIFPYMETTIKLSGSMLIFSILSVVAVIIFYFMLPEVKQKSLEEINTMMDSIGRSKFSERMGIIKGTTEKTPEKVTEAKGLK